MFKKNLLVIGFVLSLSVLGTAQDTLKLMQYNLLYYGKNVYDCNSTNNNIDNKNTNLQTILAYVKPDLLSVNEMDASLADVNYLMDNVLNINGVTHWQHATLSGSYSVNMLYYNSDKFSLSSQVNINADPRQTDVFHLVYLPTSTEITVISAHLKASNDATSAGKRADATQAVMNYINGQSPGNYIFMGDLNLYSSSEQAFQNLINPDNTSIAFYDPANRIGDWSNNYSFSDVHSQATHTSGDCFVTGGLDDRFDFILMSEDIKEGNNEIRFLSNSYETIGQDGNHFNDALIDGTNNSAPTNVINALYNMSDHLPVSMQMIFGTSSAPVTVFNKTFDDQSLTSGGWTQYSVTDPDRFWDISTNTYGHNNTYYGHMSGYDYNNSTTVENEDWLISPSFSADELNAENLTFWTSGKYTGNDLHVYYSADYAEGTDPNISNWTEITGFHLSNTSDYIWETSENIDLSQIVGANVRIGFKYTSDENSGSRSWQIDDILLTASNGNSSVKERIRNKYRFWMYPNPAHSSFIVKFRNKNTSIKEIKIYNIQGKLIKEINTSNSELNIPVEEFENGIYFVRIGTYIQKLVIQ